MQNPAIINKTNHFPVTEDTAKEVRSTAIWRSTILVCCILQVAITLLFPLQNWSMPVGLACIIFICAAITIRFRPAQSLELWRWHFVALGFGAWGIGFLAIAVQDNLLGGLEIVSSGVALVRQLLFIAVLMPATQGESARKFRTLDIVQGLIFTLLFGTITWKPLLDGIDLNPDRRFIITGYSGLFILSAMSYLVQTNYATKQLIRNLALLMFVYGLISYGAIYLHYNRHVADNSVIWSIGDISFTMYALLATRATKHAHADENTILPVIMIRRHLVPLLVSIIIILLAIIVGRANIWAGAAAGALGLLLYATRMTMLLDHYLMMRDKVILAEQAHSRLLIDMIHEIRAPLGSVVLNASMLQRAGNLEGKQAKWAQQIGAGGARVTTMLNDVLEIERIDAGLITAHIAPCTIANVFRRSIAVVAAQADSAQIAIEVHIDDDIIALADENMLDRVFINLLTNAVRFTPSGGTIAIMADRKARDMITIHIIDTGIGIAAELQTMLFSRFSHLGAPLNGARGSGLGLSICRGLMTAMNGQIKIESEMGKGTSVILEIPRSIDRPPN